MTASTRVVVSIPCTASARSVLDIDLAMGVSSASLETARASCPFFRVTTNGRRFLVAGRHRRSATASPPEALHRTQRRLARPILSHRAGRLGRHDLASDGARRGSPSLFREGATRDPVRRPDPAIVPKPRTPGVAAPSKHRPSRSHPSPRPPSPLKGFGPAANSVACHPRFFPGCGFFL